MGTPNSSVDGKGVSQAAVPGAASTIDAAAEAFAGLLFPDDAEGQDPSVEPQKPAVEAADEPQPDATDSEPSVDQTATQDAEPEPGTDTPPKRSRKLQLGGKEVEVTEDEAYLGYMRTSDYTRKTQEAAAARKAAEAEAKAAREARERYLAELGTVRQAMDTMVPAEPDFEALRTQLNPTEFASVVANWQTFQKNRAAVLAEIDRVNKDKAEDTQKRYEAYLDEQEQHLLTAVPEWRDEAVKKVAFEELAGWLQSVKGYSKHEVARLNDHRLILAFRAEMQAERGTRGKPSTRSAPRTAAPGTSEPAPTRQASTARDKAAARLKQTGKTEDAAEYFKTIL